MFEKKNIDTLSEYRPYDCTIDLKRGSTTFIWVNLQPITRQTCSSLWIHRWKLWENVHLTLQQLVPRSYLSKRRMDLCKCVLIITKLTHHQKLVSFTPIKIVGQNELCQYQDRFMWGIQLVSNLRFWYFSQYFHAWIQFLNLDMSRSDLAKFIKTGFMIGLVQI